VRIDLKDIPPTTEWWKEKCTHIEEANNFIFVISPDSCESPVCRDELANAEANHKRLIPVVYRPVGHKTLPPLARIQWIPFADVAFETALQLLIRALDTDFDWVRTHTRADEIVRLGRRAANRSECTRLRRVAQRLSSRMSQDRANCQSRSTLRVDIFMTSAISAMLKPPK
jgi:hypothetical protein